MTYRFQFFKINFSWNYGSQFKWSAVFRRMRRLWWYGWLVEFFCFVFSAQYITRHRICCEINIVKIVFFLFTWFISRSLSFSLVVGPKWFFLSPFHRFGNQNDLVQSWAWACVCVCVIVFFFHFLYEFFPILKFCSAFVEQNTRNTLTVYHV